MERNDKRVRTVRKDAGDNSNNTNNSYLDRSKVRILLCDNDAKSSKEVFTLLCKCSYQVTSVRTPRQVIDALNAEGPDIDIILAEVDLPVSKGLKLLKYIMRDAELQRIPIIMMSAQDEVSVVVKCLKHGAADYLVKPLRTNELLNLWTHMWRRRHMLGLSEKKIMNYDFDLVASDPSDANTNSTTLFSDDTDEKSRRSSILENSISNYREEVPNDAAFIEPALNSSSEHHPCVLRPSNQTAQFSSFSKKSELKIGESSAFFTYVKSSITPRIYQRMGSINENDSSVEQWTKEQETVTWSKPGGTDAQRYTSSEALENYHIGNAFLGSDTSPDTSYAERSYPPVPSEFHQARNSEEQPATVPTHPRNEVQFSVPGLSTIPSLPYYVPGMMNQIMIPSSSQLFQANQHDVQKHAASTILPRYNTLTQCSNHVPMMTSFPYYPIQVCMQTGQMPTSQLWPSNGISSSTKVKTDRIGRREAALIKFRQKRKDRCFDKKIRYMNRKRLAERRPRVRGQFVRQMNGVDVDLNGQPINGGDSDEDNEEEEEEELVSR
ncbi:Two-component response regulator-like aprr1 [Thalictrum thalictroides]|uniref:Two-component response regulator-like aprr1 n=1 Tax=Thalictrum thalictroides TaxID=46969 RepID=A0A7J6W0H4_THATH|nr:Two-component response regulator-like aprr1 [Thalictrum thalictroides]